MHSKRHSNEIWFQVTQEVYDAYSEKDNPRYHPILIEDFSPIELCGEVVMSGKGITRFIKK